MLLFVSYLYLPVILYVIGYPDESVSIVCKVGYSVCFTRGLNPFKFKHDSYNYGNNKTIISSPRWTISPFDSENVLNNHNEKGTNDRNPLESQYRNPSRIYSNTLDEDSNTKETNNASEISSLCSYDDNPHLLQQIQSRLDNYKNLTENYNVNPFPEVKSDEEYDDFERVISENQSLENGQEVERVYKIFGRVEGVRFDGHFMDLVNINKNFESYLDEDLTVRKLQRNNKIQVMFRLEDPVQLEGVSENKDKERDFNSRGYPCKEIVRLVDVGDVLQITGNIKKTNLGELSILPKKVRFLAKCLIPPPSKLHGLKDVETRFRLRHLDLLTNEDSRTLLMKRFQTIAKIRKFLSERGFVEIDTPILQHYTSGDLAEPFETFYKRLQQNVKLRIAPEFNIKRVLMGLPLNKVFEMGKCFRNEGTSMTHSPEFTMIEIYQKMADYNQMIQLLEDLVNYLLSYKIQGVTVEVKEHLKDGPNEPDVSKVPTDPPRCEYEVKWTRKTFSDLIKEYTGVEIARYTKEELEEVLRQMDAKKEDNEETPADIAKYKSKAKFETWGDVANEIFEKFVVPKLTYPVHVTNLPKQISPLTYYDNYNDLKYDLNKNDSYDNYNDNEHNYNNYNDNPNHTNKYKDNQLFSNRFESYLGGMEVANGSTEQCNPLILSKNLVKSSLGGNSVEEEDEYEDDSSGSQSQSQLKSHPQSLLDRIDSSSDTGDKKKEVDREFLHSVFCAMEPMAGLGIGVDRLVMYLTKTKNIKEVQPLPSLKKQ